MMNLAGTPYLSALIFFGSWSPSLEGRSGSTPGITPIPSTTLGPRLASKICLRVPVCSRLALASTPCLYSWLDVAGYFRCPCHGSEFRKDGSWQDGPAPRSLDRFAILAVSAASGEVVAQTDPETLAPLPVPENPDVILSVDTREVLRGPKR